jgi:hypothetical protein
MQYVSCAVQIAGDKNNVVVRSRVSVAEVLILRRIHGDDAVTDIRVLPGHTNESPVAAREELKKFYKPELVMSVYPGGHPSLPQHASDIGLDRALDEDEITHPTPAARKGARKTADEASAEA